MALDFFLFKKESKIMEFLINSNNTNTVCIVAATIDKKISFARHLLFFISKRRSGYKKEENHFENKNKKVYIFSERHILIS